MTEKTDNVNHPSHYQSIAGNNEIECIDAMKAAFGDDATAYFCVMNAFKYIWRHMGKNKNEDVKKAIWYLNKYLELGGCEE